MHASPTTVVAHYASAMRCDRNRAPVWSTPAAPHIAPPSWALAPVNFLSWALVSDCPPYPLPQKERRRSIEESALASQQSVRETFPYLC